MPSPRTLLLALLGLSAACTPRQGQTRIDRGTVIDERGAIVETTSLTESRTDSLALAPAEAIALTRNGYLALGLEPNYVDPPRGVVGVRQGTYSRRLQGVPLTAYLDCGLDANGVPFAANERIELTMLSELRPANGRTVMVTTLTGRAMRTSSGASVNPQRCSSRGTLEKKLSEVVRGAK
jgi:hypothetical protein